MHSTETRSALFAIAREVAISLESVANLLYLLEDAQTGPADRAKYTLLASEQVTRLTSRMKSLMDDNRELPAPAPQGTSD